MVARCAVLLSIAGTLIVWVQSLSISSSSSSSKRRGRQGLRSSDDTEVLLVEEPHANLLILGLGRVGWHVAQQATTVAISSSTTMLPLLPTVPTQNALDSTAAAAAARPSTARTATRSFGRIFGTVRRVTETLKVDDSEDAAATTVPITVLSWNETADILQAAQTCSHLLVTIPPPAMVNDETKGETLETATESLLYTQILQTMMLHSTSPCWIGILSTTGVYGNHNGQWVTEESPCLVDKDSSAFRYLDHEESWKRRVMDCTTVAGAAAANDSSSSPLLAIAARNAGYGLRIFRCAGIYGPSQSALHTVYKNKQAYSAPRIWASTRYGSTSNHTAAADAAQPLDTLGSATAATDESRDVTNRIHVTDLAAAIVASMQQHCDDSSDSTSTSTLEYYNLADDEPESRRVVMDHAAMLLQGIGALDVVDQESLSSQALIGKNANVTSAHAPPPPLPPRNTASARAQRRTVDAKRVSNAKMRRDLLPTLHYPTYRQGLAAILRHQPNPWHDDVPT
jgi:hypothetical protein